MSAPWTYDALPARPGGTWPDGRRLAVYVALGVEDYRFGDGRAEDLLPGVEAPDLVNTAWRDYGNRVGAFRLLDALQKNGIPPTVLLNTALYDSAPAVLHAARAAGAEFVGHGVSNSDALPGMDRATEQAYLRGVAGRIATEEGRPPVGWSTPWLAHTENTVDLLAETGYEYLFDLRLDDQPVWLRTAGAPLLALPYALELNDSTTVIGRGAGAAEFADMVVDEFDELLVASQDQPLVMSVVVHSFISGAPFRLRQLRRALAHLGAHSDHVWFTQPGHVAAAFARTNPAPSDNSAPSDADRRPTGVLR